MTFEWARVPVVRLRTASTGVDQYGVPIPGVQVREELPPGLFAPVPTQVTVDAGVDSVAAQPAVYWPGEWPDVAVNDRLLIEGEEWRVSGRPQRWPLGLVVPIAGEKGRHEDQTEQA